MILYHGTNIDFDTINLTKSHKYKDFGQGFYLTDIRKQAEELASKRSRLFGGYPVIQEYEFDEKLLEEGELRVLKFDRPSEEWADFIFKNRNRETNYIHDYDIVIGPIADDGVALKIVYQSKTYQLLQDEVGDLYRQSPSYIYELLKEEIDFVR